MSASIETSRCGEEVWIRICGRATFQMAPTLRDFVTHLDGDAVSGIRIDLSGCDWLDSTFSGTLVGLTLDSRPCDHPAIHLNRPSESCLGNLRQMHLDKLFEIESLPPPGSDEWQPLAVEGVPQECLQEVLVQAHENLASADPQNAHFARVAKAFRTDAEKQ